jgi:pyridoxine 5-phosphate synthase
MLKIAEKYKPNYVCIVPEKRSEVTTEGGLNIKKNKKILRKIIKILKRNKIRVSLFIEPKVIDVMSSNILGADCVELHTGKFCNLSNSNKNNTKEFNQIKKSSLLGEKLDMEVHAGHGMNYKTARQISRIRSISELNIGHFIISESVFLGLKNVVKNFIKIINK